MVCPICGYGQPIQPGFVSHCRHMIAQTHNYREGNLPREVYLEEVEAFYNNGPFPDTAVSVSKSVEVECRYCGADLQRQTNYCRECGASLTEPAQRS